MKQIRIILSLAVLIFILAVTALRQGANSAAAASAPPLGQQPSAPLVVELKASDGTVLKATYFATAKPGPGVLLFQQSGP
jgi:hypothetical protein